MPRSSSAVAINRLIAALPKKERQRFVAGCEQVELRFSDVLAKPGEAIDHIYFPAGSVISLVTPAHGGTSLEVGLVGSEGMLGLSLILGVDISPLLALVQGGGPALRMDVARFRREFEAGPALQRLLKCYLYVVMTQLAQTATCTHYHQVEARLARWLLMTQDRAHSDALHVTHEFLAHTLGVRRVGVTKAASALQRRNLIRYRRGDITILDRAGLELAACLCYAADRAAYTRIMG